ncbi:DNA primase [Staphylococcus phage PG-2021_40]
MRFQDFLTMEIGEPKEDAINETRYCCPFCGETKYKFYVLNSLGSDNGLFQCKKCGVKGNPITFMKEYYNMDGKTARDTLESNGISIDFAPQGLYSSELTERESLMLMLQGNNTNTIEKKETLLPPEIPLGIEYIKDNFDNPRAKPFIDYLLGRNITKNQMIDHCIGYVVNGKFRRSDGSYLPLRNSVVFFTFNSYGKYVYWNTRSIEPNPYLKTINAPAQDNEYSRKDVVFNLNKAKNQPFIVINEGVFDALTFGDFGVATFGKQVTDTQIDLILRAIKDRDIKPKIYLFLDKDATKETVTSASKLYARHKQTYVVPHGSQDANDMGMYQSLLLLKENSLLATPENLNLFLVQELLS